MKTTFYKGWLFSALLLFYMTIGGNAMAQTTSAADSTIGNIQSSAASQTNPYQQSNPAQTNLTSNASVPAPGNTETGAGFNWGWLGILGLLGLLGLRKPGIKSDLYKKESTIVTHH